VGNAGRCGDEVARPGGDLLIGNEESGLSGEHHIEFVGAGMRMERLRLSWLETVEPGDQAIRSKAIDFCHGVGAEGRAVHEMLHQFARFHG
jgi:hypothetical protein